MKQCQTLRVQQQAAGRACFLGRRIERIAHDGMAQRLQVHAQLVRASGDGLQQHAGGARSRVVRQHPPAGAAGPPLLVIDDAARAVQPVQDQGQVDQSPAVVGLGRCQQTLHHRDVLFVHLALFKAEVERALGGRATGHDDQAGGGHVEPVHHQGVGKRGLRAGRQAVLLVLAAPGHGQQAGGFVEHQQGVVGVHHLQAGRHGRARGPGRSGFGSACGRCAHAPSTRASSSPSTLRAAPKPATWRAPVGRSSTKRKSPSVVIGSASGKRAR